MIADEMDVGGVDGAGAIKAGEGFGQVIDGAAQDRHVVGMLKVGDESDLCGLLLEVAGEARPADTMAEQLLAGAEEMLGGVVCACDDSDDRSVVISKDGVTKKVGAVASEVLEDDRLGSGGPLLLRLDTGAATQVYLVLMVSLRQACMKGDRQSATLADHSDPAWRAAHGTERNRGTTTPN